MNERIRLLVEKSYIYDRQNDSSFFDKEKFAELIIKECANVAADHDALDIYEEIREHFGVEE
jgi:hypothetical protein